MICSAGSTGSVPLQVPIPCHTQQRSFNRFFLLRYNRSFVQTPCSTDLVRNTSSWTVDPDLHTAHRGKFREGIHDRIDRMYAATSRLLFRNAALKLIEQTESLTDTFKSFTSDGSSRNGRAPAVLDQLLHDQTFQRSIAVLHDFPFFFHQLIPVSLAKYSVSSVRSKELTSGYCPRNLTPTTSRPVSGCIRDRLLCTVDAQILDPGIWVSVFVRAAGTGSPARNSSAHNWHPRTGTEHFLRSGR